MEYLEKADILQINFLTIQHVGGNFVLPHNFLHEENLDYLLEIVKADMFGQPLYPEIYQKQVYICTISSAITFFRMGTNVQV